MVALSHKSARPKSPTFESPNKLDNQKLKRVSLEGLVNMWWHLGAGHQKPCLSSSFPLVMSSETLGVNPPSLGFVLLVWKALVVKMPCLPLGVAARNKHDIAESTL